MRVSVYLTHNLTVLVTLQFTDNIPPLLLARLREPVCFRTLRYTICDALSSSYSMHLNFRCSFGIVLYISVGEILKTINTQICLVLMIVLHLSPTALAIVYIFRRWFTPYTK